MSSLNVVLDACVLFPAYLRDTLLRAATKSLYKLWLTEQIMDEVRRNLIEDVPLTEEKAQKVVDAMAHTFRRSFITIQDPLVSTMPVNEKDRHILAAAVASNSQIIVTQNLKDFPAHLLSPFHIEALSADDFLVRQFQQDANMMVRIIIEQASVLRKPPRTPFELLDKLKLFAPTFAELVRRELEADIFPYL